MEKIEQEKVTNDNTEDEVVMTQPLAQALWDALALENFKNHKSANVVREDKPFGTPHDSCDTIGNHRSGRTPKMQTTIGN
jgi:hypothetical protein